MTFTEGCPPGRSQDLMCVANAVIYLALVEAKLGKSNG